LGGEGDLAVSLHAPNINVASKIAPVASIKMEFLFIFTLTAGPRYLTISNFPKKPNRQTSPLDTAK
jgi:hypothetical protein